MTIVLSILLSLTLLLTIALGAMSFNFHSSDAAGNGLAIVYILFFSAVLYALLALTLILVATRAPHSSLPAAIPWRGLSAASFFLLLLAAAAQVGAIRVLSDRDTAPLYALALQLTFFTTPIAFLLYAAWRTHGLAVPTTTIAAVCGTLILAGYILPWPGIIRRQLAVPPSQREVTPATLFYPALLIWDGSHLDPIHGPDDLATMNSNRFLHRSDDPILIDSNYRVFTLTGLKARGSSLALIATGPGPKPVEFHLVQLDKPIKSQTARDLILACPSLHPDPATDARLRAAIAQHETLDHMITQLSTTE